MGSRRGGPDGEGTSWNFALCQDCHGGDPRKAQAKAAKADATGFDGAPLVEEIPGVCGKCHAPIVAELT